MKTQGVIVGLFALSFVMAGANAVHAQGLINQQLPLYRPSDPMTGSITLIGSNTMAQLANGWIHSFHQFHPDVDINVEIRGSRAAVSSLMDGSATFGLLSRSIKKEEVDAFQQRFGYAPKRLTPGYERMAIYLNEDCPIDELTLAQVQSIFAQNGKVRTWGDVGATGGWAQRPISLQGRGPTTGSTVYFQTAILRGASFDDKLVAHSSNVKLVNAVRENPEAIGYAGLMYRMPNVKAVKLAARAGLPAVAIDGIEADQGQYPLMRPLQIVVNQAPGAEMPAVQTEFLKYVFSRLGQEDVIKGGFQPIPGQSARVALGTVGLRQN